MRKKISKTKKVTLQSYFPVNRNGWWIKFSVNTDDGILLLFTSMFTAETIIRYFDNELEAIDFINIMVMKNPRNKINV